MKGKLIIHIGPPKTASTSLQYYLQQMDIEGIKYIGTFQPREENNEFNVDFNTYLHSKREDITLKESLLDYILSHLKRYKYVIISEEMILVHNKLVSMQKKIQRLSDLTKGLNPTITMVARNVEESYFSYFVEIQSILPYKIRKDFNLFQESDYSYCYKYRSVHRLFIQNGFNRIMFLDYLDLIRNRLCINDILGIDDEEFRDKIILPSKNVTLLKNADFRVRKKNIGERIVVHLVLIKNICFPKLFNSGFGNSLVRIIRSNKVESLRKEVVSAKTLDIYKEDIKFISAQKHLYKKD